MSTIAERDTKFAHQAEQIIAADNHRLDKDRGRMVRGAIGMPKFELSKFTVTTSTGDKFRENYDKIDWSK